MELNELTSTIIGAAIKVHRALGPGLLESAYRVCLAYELTKLGLRVQQEQPIPIVYEGVQLECGFRADLLIEEQVIVECKAKVTVHPVDKAQLASHLRLMKLQVGLLINFHELLLKDGIHRIVNDYKEEIRNAEGAEIAEQTPKSTCVSAFSRPLRFKIRSTIPARGARRVGRERCPRAERFSRRRQPSTPAAARRCLSSLPLRPRLRGPCRRPTSRGALHPWAAA